MIARNLGDKGESEARSLLVRCEKGREDLVTNFIGHARSAVAHFPIDARTCRLRRQHDLALGAGRACGVLCQIEKRSPNLRAIRVRRKPCRCLHRDGRTIRLTISNFSDFLQ